MVTGLSPSSSLHFFNLLKKWSIYTQFRMGILHFFYISSAKRSDLQGL